MSSSSCQISRHHSWMQTLSTSPPRSAFRREADMPSWVGHVGMYPICDIRPDQFLRGNVWHFPFAAGRKVLGSGGARRASSPEAHVQRRGFITLLGGAAMAWPLTAHAQQAERGRRIGVLYSLAEDDPESVARRAAFEQALKELGWTSGD